MFKIINKKNLSGIITQLEIEAPLVADKARPGQFVVLINDSKGERIPLTLADWNMDKRSITVIFQIVGLTTRKLSERNIGDSIEHILGPLGHPTEIKKLGKVVCVGGGVGIAEIYPVARGFKNAGNEVIGVIGARSKDLLILGDELRNSIDELHITTDDGSYGKKGFVTDILKELLNPEIKLIYAVGPVPMMRAVTELTRPLNIKTLVSLNPIMVDATGMCGACRCNVAGKTVFACVEGPDFDAHSVDFNELEKRLNQFKDQEQITKRS